MQQGFNTTFASISVEIMNYLCTAYVLQVQKPAAVWTESMIEDMFETRTKAVQELNTEVNNVLSR